MNDIPYHLASSSSTGAAAAEGLGLAAFFLEKRATVLKAPVLEVELGAADLATPLNLRGFPSISDTPRDAAAVDAATEAIMLLPF